MKAVHTGFDLAKGPLLRAALYQLNAEDAFIFTEHSSQCHGWLVNRNLAEELGKAYVAYSTASSSKLFSIGNSIC